MVNMTGRRRAVNHGGPAGGQRAIADLAGARASIFGPFAGDDREWRHRGAGGQVWLSIGIGRVKDMSVPADYREKVQSGAGRHAAD